MKRLIPTLLFLIFGFPIWANEKEGGIIGTGVVGQVTALRDFAIGGMHFTMSSDIIIDGLKSSSDLEMGMTFAGRAARDGNEWQLTHLKRTPVLVGPITGPNEVMGVSVIGDLPDSGWVIIDGFWSETGVVASRVETTDERESRITGPYRADGRIGTVTIRNNAPRGIDDGEIVTLIGEFFEETLTAQLVEDGLFTGDAPDLILAEGFLSTPDQEGTYSLISTGAQAMSGDARPVDPAQKTMRCALRGRMDIDLAALSSQERPVVVDFCPEISGP